MAEAADKFGHEEASELEPSFSHGDAVSRTEPSDLPASASPPAVNEAELRSELEAVTKHLKTSQTLDLAMDPAVSSVIGRYMYLSLGGLSVAVGTIGVFIPGLPTTVFMIVALWAFTKSSPKMRDWLYHHRHFGPALQNWVKHRSIPVRARQIALASLLVSALIIGQTVGGLACLAFILFVCTPVASFLWTLPINPEQ
jgi:hypothetical protein